MHTPSRTFLPLLAAALLASLGTAQPTPEEIAKLEKQRCPKPTEFALVFSRGYAGNQLPEDDAKFDALLKKLKAGGFNTVHTTYTEKRLELCKKHGIKLMVDLLAPEHHVYKSPDKAKAVCEKLRGNPDVWGYNIWNDQIGKTGEGRRRDVNNVRQWDPTHPAYVGTYRTTGMNHLANADVIGYYDFHWKRGPEQHFPHALAYSKWATERDAWYYTWLSTSSGIAGKGNYNRSLYSANTSIACGCKGILWFLATDLMDANTLEWTLAGQDILRVQADLAPLTKELVKLGQPTALYSTAITKSMNNDALPEGAAGKLPGALAMHAFPKDFFVQPKGGEFLLGVFTAGDKKGGYLYAANHNAYAEQAVELATTRKLERFEGKTGRWEPLAPREGSVRFSLKPGGGELLRYAE